jgi:hypothetical protein
MTSALPPEVLLTAADVLTTAALEAMASSKLAKGWAAAATSSVSSSSSSSRQPPCQQQATQEHVPFMVSLLLTAQKCASALHPACPKLALQVAVTLGRNRIEFSANEGSFAWRQQGAGTPKSTAELRQLCINLGKGELRARMQVLAARSGNAAEDQLVLQRTQEFFESVDDACVQRVLNRLDAIDLQNILSSAPTAADDDSLLPPGRHIGQVAASEVIAAGPLVTFRPGGMNTSTTGSGNGSSRSWYTDSIVVSLTPWLTVAARSMWLMGQTLSELLPGGSSSSSNAMYQTLQQQRSAVSVPQAAGVNMVDAAYFRYMLERAHACVEHLGSQLCHMQLPGDDVAADGSSSSGADGSAASMPLLTKLLEQHAELQTGLYLAVQRCAAAGQLAATKYAINSADAAVLVQSMWGDSLPGQLSAFGAAVAAALPVGWACNNAACTNLAKLSELQLVRGKAKVCGGCKLVRMCSAECQRQHWKAGHKLVCKKLAAAAAKATPGSSSGAASGSSGAGSSCTTSAAAAAAAAAGVELPSSAAAAAALPVRQLRALLSSLGVIIIMLPIKP